MFLSIPNIAQFSFLQKKTYSYCERRIFSSSRADNFWRCIFIYPQYCKILICAGKKKERQTEKQFKLNCYIRKKENENENEKEKKRKRKRKRKKKKE